MRESFQINLLITDLTCKKESLDQLILMKNFIEKRAVERIGSFMQEGTVDSIEDAISSLKLIKSILNSISTYAELFEYIEDEEFGMIGITRISEFFIGYSEFLGNTQ